MMQLVLYVFPDHIYTTLQEIIFFLLLPRTFNELNSTAQLINRMLLNFHPNPNPWLPLPAESGKLDGVSTNLSLRKCFLN